MKKEYSIYLRRFMLSSERHALYNSINNEYKRDSKIRDYSIKIKLTDEDLLVFKLKYGDKVCVIHTI